MQRKDGVLYMTWASQFPWTKNSPNSIFVKFLVNLDGKTPLEWIPPKNVVKKPAEIT